jgi:hypothetical protein
MKPTGLITLTVVSYSSIGIKIFDGQTTFQILGTDVVGATQGSHGAVIHPEQEDVSVVVE